MDGKNLKYPDKSFDCVIMLGGTFMNLFPFEVDVLKESYRVLKENGICYFSLAKKEAKHFHEHFYRANDLEILKSTENFVELKSGLVSRRYDEEELEDILAKAHIKDYEIKELNRHINTVKIYK